MFLIGDSDTAASCDWPFMSLYSRIMITFQEIGLIDKEFPIVGKLIVLSVVFALRPWGFHLSLIPN